MKPISSEKQVPQPFRDGRRRGIPGRAPVARATAWVDALTLALPAEELGLIEAGGRVLAAPVVAPADVPARDRAADDGYALCAGETLGASDYNPLSFRIQEAGAAVGPHAAALVCAGERLPAGADAVLTFEAARLADSTLEVYRAVAPGAGVEQRSRCARAGDALLERATLLGPRHLALAATAGVERLQVFGRPRVRLIVAGPKAADAIDADGLMLRALVARDGGFVESLAAGGGSEICSAIVAPGADAILIAGRTGAGVDDEAPLALAEASELALHGVAMRPGESAGMGMAGGVPVFLLPGDPVGCLCAYEMFAGRWIRRLGGREPGLPYPVCEAGLRRKIVSNIGFVEFFPVRFAGEDVGPIGSAQSGGIASVARADGFVIVPAPSEGHPAGARVAVHLYGDGRRDRS